MVQFGLKIQKKNKKIILDKKTPIIVGGTGLYLEFISSGISIFQIFLKKLKIKLKNYLKKRIKKMFDFFKRDRS